MQRRLQALGRLPAGTMNRTEQAYAVELEARRMIGEVAWFKFEGIKLRLAPATFLTVDFAVMLTGGELEMVDVKGGKGVWTDDARAKIKIAADMYPFRFKAVYPAGRGRGFTEELF